MKNSLYTSEKPFEFGKLSDYSTFRVKFRSKKFNEYYIELYRILYQNFEVFRVYQIILFQVSVEVYVHSRAFYFDNNSRIHNS